MDLGERTILNQILMHSNPLVLDTQAILILPDRLQSDQNSMKRGGKRREDMLRKPMILELVPIPLLEDNRKLEEHFHQLQYQHTVFMGNPSLNNLMAHLNTDLQLEDQQWELKLKDMELNHSMAAV